MSQMITKNVLFSKYTVRVSVIHKICPENRWTERAGTHFFFSNDNLKNTPTLRNGISFCGRNKKFQTQSSAKISCAKFDFLKLQKSISSS